MAVITEGINAFIYIFVILIHSKTKLLFTLVELYIGNSRRVANGFNRKNLCRPKPIINSQIAAQEHKMNIIKLSRRMRHI